MEKQGQCRMAVCMYMVPIYQWKKIILQRSAPCVFYDDMVHWTDHGVCFRSSDVYWAKPGGGLGVPDCIHRNGKYYLYFCMGEGIEGVAVSDYPWGPFLNPQPIEGANRDSIDPAIFVDEDGQAYYYWGQFHLRGARMNEDMLTLDPQSIDRCIIDEKWHGFHEGSSMRKRNGLYYLVYADISRGRPACLGYSVSKSPLGPFEKRKIQMRRSFRTVQI